ncbi:AraC family transcriptional regulator, partial [Acinetobacter baumannii]
EELVAGTFGRPVDSSAETVRRALEIVAKGYSGAIKDADVAQELGLSPSHFRYLFRQQTSKPFHQYVLTYRLNRAKDLLRSTQM